jgi:hypothetical protein
MDIIHKLDHHAPGFGSALSTLPKNRFSHSNYPFVLSSSFNLDGEDRCGINSLFKNMFTVRKADADKDFKCEQSPKAFSHRTQDEEPKESCGTTQIASATQMGSGGWQDLAGEVMRNPVRVLAAPPPTQPTHLHYQSTNRTGRSTSTPKDEPSVSESPTQAATNYKIEVANSSQSGSTSGLTDAQEVFFCMERGCNVAYTGDDAEKAVCDHGRDVHYRFASLRYRVRQRTARGWTKGRVVYPNERGYY